VQSEKEAARAPMGTRVMYDGLYTFAMRILNAVCAAGLGILTARLLGPAGKGVYALPSVEAGLVAAAFTGLNSGTSYFLLNRARTRSVLTPAFLTAVLYLVAAAVVLAPIAFASGERWTYLPALLSLPGSAAINFACGYTVGIKRVRYSTTINVAVTLVTFALMAAGLLLVQRSASVAIVAWIVAMNGVGAAALLGILLHARKLPAGAAIPLGEFLRFSVKVAMVNLVSLLNYRADLYIVALMTTPAALGMYTVAVSAAESLLVPTQVAALVTAPHNGSFDVKPAAALAARCVRNNLLIALVVCGLLLVFAGPIVRLLYGAAFLPMVGALQILLGGVFAMSLGSPMATFFTLKLGKPEVPMWLAAASALLCISVSIALEPMIGIYGAAIGSSVAYACGQTAATWWFCRTTKISIRELFVPTQSDFATYLAFIRNAIADGRAIVRGAAGGHAR
jgi:O-antigen/teichoic acid export membrane protein